MACLNLCHQNSQSSRVLLFHPVFIIVTRCVTYLVLTKVSSSNDRALRSHTWVLGFKRKKYIYPSVLFLIVNATASLWNWVVRAIMQVVSRIHISRDMFSIMEMTIHVVKWRGYGVFCSECLSTAALKNMGLLCQLWHTEAWRGLYFHWLWLLPNTHWRSRESPASPLCSSYVSAVAHRWFSPPVTQKLKRLKVKRQSFLVKVPLG